MTHMVRNYLATRASAVIPNGVQTESKRRYAFGSQRFATRSFGASVYLLNDDGTDEERFLDHVSGLGSVILGHSEQGVTNAAIHQAINGVSFSLPTQLEVEVAELICEHVPSAELVRFAKNGADACAAAVRLARAFTGRTRVIIMGYHGYQDWCQVLADQHAGIPALPHATCIHQPVMRVLFNDITKLRLALGNDTNNIYAPPAAAVIMEPAMSDGRLPDPGYLAMVRELCSDAGALLIFDEMMTGFRMAVGGAQEFYKVTPDLTCLGKAMGNGFPLSAVCGRADVMRLLEDRVFFSTTFGGEAVSLAAAKETLTRIARDNIPEQLGTMGRFLKTEFAKYATLHGVENDCDMVGYEQRPVIIWRDAELRNRFERAMLERHHLFQGYHNLTAAFTEGDLQATAQAYNHAFAAVAASQ